MILQLHHSKIGNHRKTCDHYMVQQSEDYDLPKEEELMFDWLRQAAKESPPPEGYQFLIVTEGSRHFTLTHANDMHFQESTG